MSAEILLRSGRIRTLAGASASLEGEAGAGRVDEAMLVRGDRIVATGTDAEMRALAAADAQVVDLAGRTVLPGFIDAHTHVELTAMSRHFWIDVRGESRADILGRIRAHAAATEPGTWAIYQATFGADLPTLDELDAAAPRHPVAVRWSMHKFIVNRAALDVSGVDESTVPAPGMRLQRDDAGRLNGVIEEGWDLLAAPVPAEEELRPALAETLASLFLSHGVTTVHEIVASRAGAGALCDIAETQGPRIGLNYTVAPGHQALVDRVPDASLLGIATRRPRARAWVQGLKIFMDGGRDGAFRSNDGGRDVLAHDPAERWGLLTRLYPTLVDELATAARLGIRVMTHAIGDLSQEIAVSAVEQVRARHPELDLRMRIEHFFNESTGTRRLERLVAAGGIAVPNPGFVFAEPDDPARRQPQGATKYALATLRRIQGVIPGNSDTAGAQPFTTNPWFTMQCMVLLRNRSGLEITPGEQVDLAAALRAFTVDAAWATGQEDEKGSLEPGKLADFSVIDADPFGVDLDRLDTIGTVATVIGGAVAFGELP
ncbi:amidohydrolase family protein [Microbacterium sp. NPDC096154]|uniref:amidohydrolase n=1 Tax=Microbacterium sp. NPDC096154 TaxID=3155549 RepID=UPI0033306801